MEATNNLVRADTSVMIVDLILDFIDFIKGEITNMHNIKNEKLQLIPEEQTLHR